MAKITECKPWAAVSLCDEQSSYTTKTFFNKLAKLLDKDNVYRKEMDIVFTDKKNFKLKTIDNWITCFAYITRHS
jgi:hypothetical protein